MRSLTAPLTLEELIPKLIILLFCIPMHELTHAFVAYKLGDYTQKEKGRLSLNPLRHYDLLGAVMILTVGFGWGKPVAIDARNFKNPKAGFMITAFAGPISDFLRAWLLFFILKGLMYINLVNQTVITIFLTAIVMEFYLCFFNLIPFPPLDGSRIFLPIFPDKINYWIERNNRYLVIGFLLLSTTGIFSNLISTITRPFLQIMSGLL